MAVKEILRMEKIVKQYVMGEEVSTVLKGIDLTVNEGEFLALLGPSGSGKSTLMNIIGCLDTPTSGDYYLSGRHIFNQDEKTLAHIRSKEIGFIFQSFYLLQRQSALDNVMLPLIYAGMNTREREERAKLMLERVGLVDKMYHFPNQMSGGQPIPRFCLRMNLQVHWTRKQANRSWKSSTNSMKRAEQLS